MWNYDESTGVQKLIRMRCLCPGCHEVKHYGLACIRGRDEFARMRLSTINEWTDAQVADHIDEQSRVWQRRSSRSWELDITHLSGYGVDVAEVIKAKDRPIDESKARQVFDLQYPREDVGHWWKHKKRTLERRKKKAAEKNGK